MGCSTFLTYKVCIVSSNELYSCLKYETQREGPWVGRVQCSAQQLEDASTTTMGAADRGVERNWCTRKAKSAGKLSRLDLDHFGVCNLNSGAQCGRKTSIRSQNDGQWSVCACGRMNVKAFVVVVMMIIAFKSLHFKCSLDRARACSPQPFSRSLSQPKFCMISRYLRLLTLTRVFVASCRGNDILTFRQ